MFTEMLNFEFEIYQWLVPMVGIFFIARTIIQFIRKRRNVQNTIIWLTFWISIILLAVIPNFIAENMAKVLGFKDVVNAVIFVALGMLFVFIYFLSSTIEKLEFQLANLVRKMAIYKNELNDDHKIVDINLEEEEKKGEAGREKTA